MQQGKGCCSKPRCIFLYVTFRNWGGYFIYTPHIQRVAGRFLWFHNFKYVVSCGKDTKY